MKPEIFKRLDNFRQIIQNAYPQPKGANVHWYHQVFGTPLYKNGTVTYAITNYLLDLYCNPDLQHLLEAGESSDGISAYINFFGGYLSFDTTLKVGHLYAAFMYPRIGQLKGTDLFQVSLVRVNERFIIVSKAGQLPYVPLTRKQYLTALKEKFEKEKQSSLDKQLPYRKEENSKKNLIDYINRGYDPKLKAINDYLSGHNDDDLNQTALVRNYYDTKFTEEKNGGRMIVLVNTDYFNKNLKPYAPQFVLIHWKWDDGEGPPGGLLKPVAPDMNVCCMVSKFFKESIEQNLDVGALKQLLDK
ncbi:MAG: hypothetical protein JST13_08655 [Bacteroidetes bacterium]|nr:hypothetical protein [Bacteroidota bacterium]